MRVLLVDDEPLAREGLQLQLEEIGGLTIVETCCDGDEAVKAIEALTPELVFLDINMPGGDGFSVIERTGVAAMPRVIFLTAYDEFAIDAFRVNALDYLLKPVSTDRLRESVHRARAELARDRQDMHARQLQCVLEQLGRAAADDPAVATSSPADARLMIRNAGHVHFIRLDDIQRIQADGDYVTVHTDDRSHLLRDTMKNMEQRLAERGFQRIHRSSLVRLDLIRELVAQDDGGYLVILRDGTALKLGRSYRDALCSRLRVSL